MTFLSARPWRVAAMLTTLVFLALSCSTGNDDAPTGTPTDPVDTCTKMGQVCRLQNSVLGVCVAPGPEQQDACKSGEPCFLCAPQH